MPSPDPQPVAMQESPQEPTKVCPYCAETIKAAAIKCRYCQSDLTDAPGSSGPGPLTATPPAPPVGTVPVPAAGERSVSVRSGRAGGGALPRVLLVGALVVALVLLSLAFRDWRKASGLTDGNNAARTVQAMVTDRVEGLLSYKYSTFDKDLAASEKTMTSSFRKKYAPTVAEIRSRAIAQKRSQQADVRAVAVLSQSADKVDTLVFVDTLSYRADSKKRNLMQNRIKVTMVKQNGTWLVDDLEVPQS